MSLAAYLPLAFVMVAGPQILSSIFLATSEHWQRNSAAYVVGAALSLTLMVTVGFLLSSGASDGGASNETLNIIVIVLLVVAGIHTYLTRNTSKPPKWMGKLETAKPRFSFRLGFLLLGFFPTDILTSIAVGGHLSAQGNAWTDGLGFIFLTLLLLALPALALVAFGERAQDSLPKVRDWMNTHSWVVSEVVIAFFIVLTASNLSG